MSIVDEIRKEPITEVVSPGALAQLDLLVDKLKTALRLQEQLNRAMADAKRLSEK